MGKPNEIWEDLSNTIKDGKVVYTVRKPPYLAGSVYVWRNGMLQDADFHTELDPTTGTVELCEALWARDELDTGLHISYLTYEPSYVDPNAPVHISSIKQGDVVRIATRPGRHLNPIIQPKTKQFLLLPGGVHNRKSRAARNFSRTVFLGYVTQNDTTSGIMTLQVEDRPNRDHKQAILNYSDIQHIQKYVTPSVSHTSTSIGGGRAPQKRPGVVAKGVFDYPGFMNLVRVFF